LGDLLEVDLVNGRSVPTAEKGFPVLRLTALKHGVIDLSERKLGAWTASDAHRYLVRTGDFLVARGNGSLGLVGRGALVEERDPESVAFPDTLIRVRVRESDMKREYLRLVWDSRLLRQQIEERAHTTAGIYKINQSMLRSLRVPVPPRSAQDQLIREAASAFRAAEALEHIVTSQAADAEQLREALVQTALSGQLVVGRAPRVVSPAPEESGPAQVRGA
jgi:type I restriction enzyme S subunit